MSAKPKWAGALLLSLVATLGCGSSTPELPTNVQPAADARIESARHLAAAVLERCPYAMGAADRERIGSTPSPAEGFDLAGDREVVEIDVWCMVRDGTAWEGAPFQPLRRALGPASGTEGFEHWLVRDGERFIKIVQPSVIVGEPGAFDLMVFLPDAAVQRAAEVNVSIVPSPR